VRSISKTITLTTILWVALILAVGQVFIDSAVSGWLLRQSDNALEAKARALVTLTKYDGKRVELDFADEFMPEFEAPSDPEYFELFRGDGSLLERSRSYSGYAVNEFVDQAAEVLVTDLRLPDGRDGRRVSVKFMPQIEDLALRAEIPVEIRPMAILHVSRERESLDLVRTRFHLLVIGITLVTLFFVMLGVTRAIKKGLAPLIRMKDDISQISPRSIDRRIACEGQPAELEPIATQFNLALSEIEKAFIRERQFSSDVAHELRTPVAEIRSLAEVGQRWPSEKDISSYFADILESSIHLDWIIENLLHLCRSEEGGIEPEPMRINLQHLLDKVCASMANEVRAKNISIERVQAALPDVIADSQLMESILQNLIINAICHSRDGACVTIDVDSDSAFQTLKISNQMANPLSSRDLDMIFERFWRKNPAREPGRHAGIGLALVRSYAKLMQREVTASLQDEDRFTIQLSRIRIA